MASMPKEVKNGLETLASLGDHEMDILLDLVVSQSASLNESKFRRNVAETFHGQFREIPKQGISDVVQTLFGFVSAIQKEDVRPSDVVARIAADGELDIPSDQRAVLQSRLTTLMGVESIHASQSARDAWTGNERNYSSAKSSSEVRPVFLKNGQDVEAKTFWSTSVILHTLEITYDSNSGEEKFYVVLDSRDIKQLKTVLEEAIDQEDTIKEMFATKKIGWVDVN